MYFLDGISYRGSICSIRLRKPIFSTTERGWSSCTMKLSTFSVIPLAFGLSAESFPHFFNASVIFCRVCCGGCSRLSSSYSVGWRFSRCLRKLVVLYEETLFPPLGTSASHISHFAVLLFGVSIVKYLQIKDMFALSVALGLYQTKRPLFLCGTACVCTGEWLPCFEGRHDVSRLVRRGGATKKSLIDYG